MEFKLTIPRVDPQHRRRMIEQQLRNRGVVVSNVIGSSGALPSLLDAMFDIPRELFLPTRFFQQAYEDIAIPLGYQRYSYPPCIIAYMTEAAEVSPSDRVLDIGTGCGYPAAVLSRLVKNVFTIEPVEELYEDASDRFQDLGYNNVSVVYGDTQYGFPAYAPYNAIFVRDANTEISPMLLQQLAINGRMIVPLRREQVEQQQQQQPMDEEGVAYASAPSTHPHNEVLLKLTKVGDNMFIEETLMEYDPSMIAAAQEQEMEQEEEEEGQSIPHLANSPRIFFL